jgi:hypothetical protein
MYNLHDYYEPKHFKAYEFLPPKEYAQYGAHGLVYHMDVRILITADQVRNFFGAPVIINDWYWAQHKKSLEDTLRFRGYRPARFYKQPAAWASQHRFGRAIDFNVHGCTAAQVRDVVLNHQTKFEYITRIEDSVDWVHVDCANDPHHGIHLFQP